MNTNTLLQILFANGHEALVALAVKLDNNIEEDITPENIIVECDKKYVPAGFKTKENSGYYIKTVMPVVAFNKYKIKDQYLVAFPDGTTAWKSISTGSLTDLIPIENAISAQ
jgi:hypothetical protein